MNNYFRAVYLGTVQNWLTSLGQSDTATALDVLIGKIEEDHLDQWNDSQVINPQITVIGFEVFFTYGILVTNPE